MVAWNVPNVDRRVRCTSRRVSEQYRGTTEAGSTAEMAEPAGTEAMADSRILASVVYECKGRDGGTMAEPEWKGASTKEAEQAVQTQWLARPSTGPIRLVGCPARWYS